MTEAVRLFFFTPSGYALLREAVAVASLPKKERLPALYRDYFGAVERDERGLEGDGIVVQRRVLSVEAMLRWLDDKGLLPDRKGRERYVRAVYGEDPMKKGYRRRGMLLAWGSGGDTHWDGEPEPSNTNDWFARLDAQRRAGAARASEAREADSGRYSPWGDWRAVWRPGC